MKRRNYIALALAAVMIFSLVPVRAHAEAREYSWFFKRNGHERPEITDGERLIGKYGGVCVDRRYEDDRVIYITFDVGYENGNVKKILDTLRAEGVPAAFFVLDNIIYKNLDLVNEMSEDGHLVCNHTKKHKNISSYTREQISQELGALETLYNERTGKTMSKYFRFPEGRYSESALAHLEGLGYKTVFWSFAYDDWDNARQPSPERALKRIIDNTHNGEIILLHPTSATNATILPTLIAKRREMGYRFGTLDELFDVRKKDCRAVLFFVYSILLRFFISSRRSFSVTSSRIMISSSSTSS